MADDYEEIDLAALTDDELVEQMHNDLYDGMKDEIVQGTNILLERGFAATKVLDDALVAGMKIVGIDFRDGILFVPEVLLAANAMKAGMEILRPLLAETGAEPVDFICDLLLAEDLHVNEVTPGPHTDGIRRFLAHPIGMVGTDSTFVGAKPSPRTYGSFPRILGQFVRDERRAAA